MIKLQTDEYEYLVNETEKLHKEGIEFIEGYLAELNSILIPNDGFHTELVSEKMKILLEIFQGHMFPILRDMFRETEQNIALLGEEVSGADEEGRQRVQWEE